MYVDLKTSNLRQILQREQDSSDWQFDKELDATDKSLSEEELLPLTTMDHSLSGGETVPYYKFINEKLLEIAKSEICLDLLYVDTETKDDFSKHQSRKFDKKFSFCTRLTDSIKTNSSAQVSFVSYSIPNDVDSYCV